MYMVLLLLALFDSFVVNCSEWVIGVPWSSIKLIFLILVFVFLIKFLTLLKFYDIIII
jgi:hypothetical protein